MNLKLKLIPVLLLGVALTYSACKKSDSNSNMVDAKTISSQIALNLSESLYNGFGAFNLSDGISSPGGLAAKRNQIIAKMHNGRLGINDVGSGLICGLSVDTTFTLTTTLGDNSTASVAGTTKFTFLCTNNTPSGFAVLNNITVTESTPQVSGTVKLDENLTLQAVDPLNNNSDINFSGTLGVSDNLKDKSTNKTTTDAYNYTFNSIIIGSDDGGAIKSGAATFTTKGTNASGSWNYNGTITFLGDGKVKITINGTAYNVDLQTGVVS